MWGILVRKVYSENKQYNTIAQLKVALITALNKISERDIIIIIIIYLLQCSDFFKDFAKKRKENE